MMCYDVPSSGVFRNLTVLYLNDNCILLDLQVGFISDVPTELIASFHATLEDAVLADLLIHVRDVSHPGDYSRCVSFNVYFFKIFSTNNDYQYFFFRSRGSERNRH